MHHSALTESLPTPSIWQLNILGSIKCAFDPVRTASTALSKKIITRKLLISLVAYGRLSQSPSRLLPPLHPVRCTPIVF